MKILTKILTIAIIGIAGTIQANHYDGGVDGYNYEVVDDNYCQRFFKAYHNTGSADYANALADYLNKYCPEYSRVGADYDE